MRVLDLYCGAGGAAMGYYQAGFTDIVGVDIRPQKRYPFAFVQEDALEYLATHGQEFDFIHASPPCQAYSVCTPLAYRGRHPQLIPLVRSALQRLGKPYVIENVENARKHLCDPLMLCGTMFDLPIWRHRYFEIVPHAFNFLPWCDHRGIPVLITGTTRRKGHARKDSPVARRRQAIGIDWMSIAELDEAIPPAYTRWIGEQFLAGRR